MSKKTESSSVSDKLTKAQFDFYQKNANEFIEKLGLKEYKVYYCFEGVKDGYGQCAVDHDGGMAIIWLANKWDGFVKPTKENLREVACHEVLELLLSRLYDMALTDGVDEKYAAEERHRLIRRLEKLLV